jgi:hypothetical protein
MPKRNVETSGKSIFVKLSGKDKDRLLKIYEKYKKIKELEEQYNAMLNELLVELNCEEVYINEVTATKSEVDPSRKLYLVDSEGDQLFRVDYTARSTSISKEPSSVEQLKSLGVKGSDIVIEPVIRPATGVNMQQLLRELYRLVTLGYIEVDERLHLSPDAILHKYLANDKLREALNKVGLRQIKRLNWCME